MLHSFSQKFWAHIIESLFRRESMTRETTKLNDGNKFLAVSVLMHAIKFSNTYQLLLFL